MASPIQWTWVWANSRRWWTIEKSGVLQSMGSQRVRHDLETEQQQQITSQKSQVSMILTRFMFPFVVLKFLVNSHGIQNNCTRDFPGGPVAKTPCSKCRGCCCCSSLSHYVWLFETHELQHARLPCPSLSPGVCSNSCSLSQWCYLTISSSATMQGAWVQSLARELDPACCNQDLGSQIN